MVREIDYAVAPRRDILCIDVKSFFASVECMKRHLNPLTAYLVVMSHAERQGGLVLAASPMVKAEFGIKTGSRRYELPDDPRIIIAPPRMNLYLHVNEMILKIARRYVSNDDLYVFSIDEFFMDVTQYHALFGDTMTIAKRLQQDIWQELRLAVTIGIGENPFLGKSHWMWKRNIIGAA